MALEIVQAGDPVLREVANPVATGAIGSAELNELIAEMVETMREAPGVGLAAPQIGLPLALCILEYAEEFVAVLPDDMRDEQERQHVPLTVLINPKLVPVGSEKVTFAEGCLSVAGWAADTPRYRSVKVNALNQHGESVELNWSGWPARILQHEIDHLNGHLYIDHMDSRTFQSTAMYFDDDDLPKRDKTAGIAHLFDQDSDHGSANDN